MAKANIEKASDAWVNPPTPEDPTSDVTRDGGNPLHKPPMRDVVDDDGNVREGYVTGESDEEVEERLREPGSTKAAAVPSRSTDDDPSQRWADDPMPEGASERMAWVQRGTDTRDRIDAAIRAEEARGARKRSTLLSGLQALQREERASRRDSTGDGSTHDN